MLFYAFFFWFFRVLFYVLPAGFVLLLVWLMAGRLNPADLNSAYAACAWLILLTPLCRFMSRELDRKRKLQRLRGEG